MEYPGTGDNGANVYGRGRVAVRSDRAGDADKERFWARSELISPRDGTIVERNVSSGEYVADNTINLFTIAEVDRLLVIANPPEDQLPALLALQPDQMRWSLQMVGAPPIDGFIEEVGYLIDANQHTAVVKGYIDNRDRKLRGGQYVSATVVLPPPQDTVEAPLTALAEDGKQSFVFVQSDPAEPQYTMRRVLVTHRSGKTAFVQSRLTRQQQKQTPQQEAQQGLQPCQSACFKPGEPHHHVRRFGAVAGAFVRWRIESREEMKAATTAVNSTVIQTQS